MEESSSPEESSEDEINLQDDCAKDAMSASPTKVTTPEKPNEGVTYPLNVS
jgi:hypothetical protein